MIIYFEVLEEYSIVKPGIYSVRDFRTPPGPYLTASNRAWEEAPDGRVNYIQHPDHPDPWNHIVVDLQEFFWIKLQAKAL